MTKIEMGQYIIDHFTLIQKKVVDVQMQPPVGEQSLAAKVFFDDGTYRAIVGKLAEDLQSSE